MKSAKNIGVSATRRKCAQVLSRLSYLESVRSVRLQMIATPKYAAASRRPRVGYFDKEGNQVGPPILTVDQTLKKAKVQRARQQLKMLRDDRVARGLPLSRPEWLRAEAKRESGTHSAAGELIESSDEECVRKQLLSWEEERVRKRARDLCEAVSGSNASGSRDDMRDLREAAAGLRKKARDLCEAASRNAASCSESTETVPQTPPRLLALEDKMVAAPDSVPAAACDQPRVVASPGAQPAFDPAEPCAPFTPSTPMSEREREWYRCMPVEEDDTVYSL